MDVSVALKLLREYYRLPQKRLAAKLKISASHLSELESGKKLPSLEVLSKYSKQFRMPVSEIIRLAEYKTSKRNTLVLVHPQQLEKLRKMLEWSNIY